MWYAVIWGCAMLRKPGLLYITDDGTERLQLRADTGIPAHVLRILSVDAIRVYDLVTRVRAAHESYKYIAAPVITNHVAILIKSGCIYYEADY